MKQTLQKIYEHRKLYKTYEWGKMLSITGLMQLLVQGIGFMSGIMIIRLLPPHEYALYTLANTMLGTMTALADGGITTGVLAQGGNFWKDNIKLGLVLSTGMYLRKKFALVSLLLISPILFFFFDNMKQVY